MKLSFLKKYAPGTYTFIRKWYYYVENMYRSASFSYSQEGEDLILNKLFNNKKTGLYVDVGAYHPVKFSNTYFFYKRGWSGINIDAMPGSMRLFRRKRKRDINIESGIAMHETSVMYYRFEESAYNTFSEELAERNKGISQYKDAVSVRCQPLSYFLRKHIESSQKIDFMSIDVEGYDLEVLKSNDWEKFVPKVILIEDHAFNIEIPSHSKVFNYLKEKGYNVYAKTGNNLIFVNKKVFDGI